MKKHIILMLSIALIVSLALSGCGPREEGEMGEVLRVLNWQGYGSDETWALEQFEEMYGVRVEHDYITSEEELLTKLRTSPGVYDVVLPNIAYLQIAMEEGLLDPVDTGRLENWDTLLDRFQSLETIREGGDVYGVPWAWGATAMVYNAEEFPQGFDTWNVFWDEQYAGQIGWWDSYEDSVVLVGIALGDPTPYDPDDLDAVKAKMLELMPNVRTLWTSEDEFDKLFANSDISMGVFWSGSAARAKNAMGLPMEFVIPREGAIGWIDTWAIAKDAPNPEAAYAFIDYMIGSDFYVRWDTEVGAPTPTSQATLDALPADSFNRTVMGDPAVVSRLIWMETVPEEERQQWNQVWEEVKAQQ